MTDRPTWPAERFYWAVLDAPGAGRPGELPPGLSAMLEDDAPIRACDVHAVGVPLAGDRLAVCAAERRELADLPAGVLSLCPAGLPAFLEGEGVAPDRFNLLVGMYEPRPYRLARIRRHAVAAAVVVLCGLLVCVGLLRREAHWRARAESTRAAAVEVASAAVPGARPEDLGGRAARLRGAHDALAKAAPAPDAARALAALLHVWPTSVPSRPQSVSVSPSGISVSVALEGDPAAFLRALTPPAGWTLEEPRLSTADRVTRLSLQLRPSGRTP